MHLDFKKAGFLPVFLFLVLSLSGCSPKPEKLFGVDALGLPSATTQLLLVSSADWDTSTAVLQRMEKQGKHWHAVGHTIPVRLGRNGLAWGVGLHEAHTGMQKMEGDGRAPAGIFPLGMAFGYAKQAPAGLQMPYWVASERDYFVDAVESPDYNRWRSISTSQPNEPKDYWRSFERMSRDDHQYEYGVLVGHNLLPTLAGRGSAIFLHVWLNPETPTSGCTATSVDNLREVLAWLRLSANPLLVQAPKNALATLRFQGFQ